VKEKRNLLILVQNQDTKLLHKKLNSGNNIGKNTPTQASSALTDCPVLCISVPHSLQS
jgi:hypothetical protein